MNGFRDKTSMPIAPAVVMRLWLKPVQTSTGKSHHILRTACTGASPVSSGMVWGLATPWPLTISGTGTAPDPGPSPLSAVSKKGSKTWAGLSTHSGGAAVAGQATNEASSACVPMRIGIRRSDGSEQISRAWTIGSCHGAARESTAGGQCLSTFSTQARNEAYLIGLVSVAAALVARLRSCRGRPSGTSRIRGGHVSPEANS